MNPRAAKVLSAVLSLSLATLLGGCKDGAAPVDDYRARHPAWRRARLVVTDLTAPFASIIDIEDEDVTGTVTLPAVALTLDATDTGDHGLVFTTLGLAAITSGVAVWHHIDHLHIYKFPAKVEPQVLGGSAPRFVAANDKSIAVTWMNGTGQSVKESALLLAAQARPAAESWNDVQLVVPLAGGHVVVGKDALTAETVLRFFRPQSNTNVALGMCPAPRTFAVTLTQVAVACPDGIALVTVENESADPTFLLLPTMGPPISWLGLHATQPWVFASQGPRHVTLLAKVPSVVSQSIDSDVDVCSWSIDPGSGADLVALGADGMLRVFDTAQSKERGRLRIAGKHACSDTARPRLALAPERAYVTDGKNGQVVDVDLRVPRIFQRFSVSGVPSLISVLALDVRNINVAPGGENEMTGSWWNDGGIDSENADGGR